MLIALRWLVLLSQVGQPMEHCGVGFEADYEKVVVTIESDGRRTESHEQQRLYRDSKGRMRMEFTRVGDQGVTLRFAWINDQRNGRSIVLDLATGKPLPRRPRQPPDGQARSPGPTAAAVPPAAQESQTREDLGEAQIEGLAARGWRFTSPSFVSEAWKATLIDEPALLRKSRQPGEEKMERLFNIRLGEPNPSLFAALDAPQ
jgi:hypothetical protein